MSRLTITIQTEDLNTAKNYCTNTARTMSGLTRLALKKFLEENKK